MSVPRSAPIILFVDDEQLARKYFERAFGREMNVRTAASADEARGLLHRYAEEVAVLMTDQRMPAGDGVALLSEVKDSYPHIVRLLTTAYTDIEDAVAAVNRGEVWRYITKPWKLEDLRTELNAAMELFRFRAYEQALLRERRRSMLLVASHIAHEMRTPLRSIRSAAGGIDRYLPRLLEGHDWAVRAGAEVEPLTDQHRHALEGAVASVQRVVDRANSVIDVLLANCGVQSIDAAAFESCSMHECVEIALQDFPFTEREGQSVYWDGGPDFRFHGSTNLMVFVLHNLLRNALRAIAAAGHGTVNLWTDTQGDVNGFHIKDTGTGIDTEVLPKIFDDFTSFADDQRGVGIGLGFCRRVLTSFGGHIECHSEKNVYTQFDLWLPGRIDG